MSLITSTNLDYLITPLRLHLDDNDAPYEFSDNELKTRLVYAVKALMSRWNNKYLIDNDTNDVKRNANWTYIIGSPPIVQHSDERPIILQASIDIKSAALYNSSWNVGKWRDDEVSYSNVEGAKSVEESLLRDIQELEGLLPTARKRLAQPKKHSLPGFILPDNIYEG